MFTGMQGTNNDQQDKDIFEAFNIYQNIGEDKCNDECDNRRFININECNNYTNNTAITNTNNNITNKINTNNTTLFNTPDAADFFINTYENINNNEYF